METALTVQQSNIPRQTEDDCGVFCCARTIHAALNLKDSVPGDKVREMRGMIAQALLTGTLNWGVTNNAKKKKKKKSPTKDKDTKNKEPECPWDMLFKDEEIFERYCNIAGELLVDDHFTWQMLLDEVEKAGSLERWCRGHEGKNWKQIH